MDRKLKNYLDESGVKYERIPHVYTETAMETAHATHVDGQEVAKSVILRIDGVLTMVVVPATHYVDLDHLEILTGADMILLADEHEFRDRFRDCEVGTMPPFGRLYGMDLYASDAILEDEKIVFHAGTHTEAVRMSVSDYLRLAAPTVHHLSHAQGMAL
jgi:Ala-tRNA(Pro) deacylase